MVIDYDGRILAQADPGPGEKVVVAPINVEQLRKERQRRSGHDLRAHVRSELHTYLQRQYLPPGDPATTSIDTLSERIAAAKTRLND